MEQQEFLERVCILGENKLVLLCAATRRDIARIKMVARKIDSKSFIIITNSREVVGLGFKRT